MAYRKSVGWEHGQSTVSGMPLSLRRESSGSGERVALAIVWCREDPELVGALLLPPLESDDHLFIFGRGGTTLDRADVLAPIQQRPGSLERQELPSSPRISRTQLSIQWKGSDTLTLVNIGRCPLWKDGSEQQEVRLHAGDLVELRDEMLFLCVMRPAALPPIPEIDKVSPSFGEPDLGGQVGESPAMWEVRRQARLLGSQLRTHILILGASGTGKELAAQAIHLHSPQRTRKVVSRNAATFPAELIDAEMLGNLKNYPNPGMPERPGLLGEADGSSLFLDEFGEMGPALQAHLLRVLDCGEYQRLGEATTRRSDFRLIAATNRSPEELKFDILARLKARLILPDLNARREDIPLLVRHLMHQHFRQSPELAGAFFRDVPRCRDLRITPAFMAFLVTHSYRTHVRELDRFLIDAMRESRDQYLDLPLAATRATSEPLLSLLVPQVSRVDDTNLSKPRSGSIDTLASPISLEDSGVLGRSARAESVENPRTSNLASTSGQGAHEEGDAPVFTADEICRLEMMRKHAFSATACGKDPAYSGNRSKADLHMRRLFAKALWMARNESTHAAELLAGPENPSLLPHLTERLHAFLHNLRQRLETSEEQEAAAFRLYLQAEYKGYRRYVLLVLSGHP